MPTTDTERSALTQFEPPPGKSLSKKATQLLKEHVNRVVQQLLRSAQQQRRVGEGPLRADHIWDALLAEPELAWLTDRIGLRPSALGACVPPPPRTSDVGGGSGEDELQGWKRRRVAAGSGSLLAWEDPGGRLVATRPSKKRRGGRGAAAAVSTEQWAAEQPAPFNAAPVGLACETAAAADDSGGLRPLLAPPPGLPATVDGRAVLWRRGPRAGVHAGLVVEERVVDEAAGGGGGLHPALLVVE